MEATCSSETSDGVTCQKIELFIGRRSSLRREVSIKSVGSVSVCQLYSGRLWQNPPQFFTLTTLSFVLSVRPPSNSAAEPVFTTFDSDELHEKLFTKTKSG
jgi:hypothetical protein